MAKDYLGLYAPTSGARKFQEGGVAPGPEAPAAPAPQGGAPDLEGMVAQYAETKDPQLAVAIADALVQMLGAQGGAPAPAPAMNKGGRMNYVAPMFKKGGKLKV